MADMAAVFMDGGYLSNFSGIILVNPASITQSLQLGAHQE